MMLLEIGNHLSFDRLNYDYNYLLSGSDDKTLRIWDTKIKSCLQLIVSPKKK